MNKQHITSIEDSRIIAWIDNYQQLGRSEREKARRKKLAQFPELAADLNACLDGLELMDGFDLATSMVDEVDNSEPQRKTLGDFRIIREIGRGGMGIVYRAEQLSLGRIVALKILPFASMLGEKHRRRFDNEARAAASLEHPNIVPVFGTGVERGVHYYAMRLIEGLSLAEVLQHLRMGQKRNHDATKAEVAIDTHPIAHLSTQRTIDCKEYYKTVARIGIQAADALQYAHESGVVHRDIKPANLMLDNDGRLWITDFGLAQLESSELTVSGDLLGTARYMSPEQARIGEIPDHRSDIYSLSVTLYELLTLTPLIDGEDRAAMQQQLEASVPYNSCSFDPTVPAGLRRVLMKAMAESEQRYQTARDFADDLRRFVNDEHVLATRPSQFSGVARWIRKNKLSTAFLGVLIGLLLLLAVLGPVLVLRFRHLAADRKQMSDELSEVNQRLVQSNQELTRNNAELVKILSNALEVTVQTLENVPENELIDEQLCFDLIEDYERILANAPHDPLNQYQLAKAYWKLWWAHRFRFNESSKTKDWMSKAQHLGEQLVAQHPNNAEYHHLLSDVHYLTGFAKGEAPSEHIPKSLDHGQRAHDLDPDNAEYEWCFAGALGNMARYLHSSGDIEQAKVYIGRSNQIFESLLKRYPSEPEYGCNFAWYLRHQAEWAFEDGERSRGIALLHRGILLQEKDYSKSKCRSRYVVALAGDLRRLGSQLAWSGEFAQGEVFLRRSTEVLVEMRDGFGEASWVDEEDMHAHLSLAENLAAQQKLDEAIECLNSAIGRWTKTESFHDGLNRGDARWLLGQLLWITGRHAESRSQLEVASQERRNPRTRMNMLLFHPIHDKRDGVRAEEELGTLSDRLRNEFLGATYFLQGKPTQAKIELQRAIHLHNRPIDHLLLAMTHHALDEQEQARIAYETALDMAKSDGRQPALMLQLLAEASDLLGIKDFAD